MNLAHGISRATQTKHEPFDRTTHKPNDFNEQSSHLTLAMPALGLIFCQKQRRYSITSHNFQPGTFELPVPWLSSPNDLSKLVHRQPLKWRNNPSRSFGKYNEPKKFQVVFEQGANWLFTQRMNLKSSYKLVRQLSSTYIDCVCTHSFWISVCKPGWRLQPDETFLTQSKS